MNNKNKTKMQIVGALRNGASPQGDDSFYDNLFPRLISEVQNIGNLTRYVTFDYLTTDEHAITFFGIEVDNIDNIPKGMIALDLTDDNVTILEEKNNEQVTIWQEQLNWTWKTITDSSCNRDVMGEFSFCVPPEWCCELTSNLRHFSMTANMYVIPGKSGADDSIKLVEYNPEWKKDFTIFSDLLREFLGSDLVLRIEHIGSTAVPGLIAKPVIDILVEVPSILEAKKRILPLINEPSWGYFWYHDHITLVKRDKVMGSRTHHIHIMAEGENLQARLQFRDYLRGHKADTKRYAELKRQLAISHNDDREHYTHAKTKFITDIVSKAKKSTSNK